MTVEFSDATMPGSTLGLGTYAVFSIFTFSFSSPQNFSSDLSLVFQRKPK